MRRPHLCRNPLTVASIFAGACGEMSQCTWCIADLSLSNKLAGTHPTQAVFTSTAPWDSPRQSQ
ncbi:hypothetical protein OH77DRAFT_1425983 [Trametes cingulata]|nr:hypothetical protein OH77DRAFT_1425983 [Trametes cingulata]